MEKKEISELSIGDWVRNSKGTNLQITEIPWNCIVTKHKGIEHALRFSSVHPIPLTPEILEKNGWAEYSDVHNSWKLDIADNMRVWLFKNSHDWTFQVMNWGLGHNHCMAKAYITSIHQLQNALRLAGVGKDIVL